MAVLTRRQRKLALLAAAAAIYVGHYLASIKRIRVHHMPSEGDSTALRLSRILAACPTLRKYYWPTLLLHTPLLQFVVLAFKEARARLLPSPYTDRKIIGMLDGERVACDWMEPPVIRDDAPAVVLLHGAFQDSQSATMADLAQTLASRGLPVVVMNRRGYGGLPLQGTRRVLSLFGLDEDLDQVLAHVGQRLPGRPVALVGFSCGSGFGGRYLGTKRAAQLSTWSGVKKLSDDDGSPDLPQLLCGVAIDPGYTVGTRQGCAATRIRPPYSWALNLCLKYFYVFRHRRQIAARSPSSPELVKRMLRESSMHETYKLSRRLSGCEDEDAWIRQQQANLGEISLPCLLLNSRDDPICVWDNVEANFGSILGNPNLALAEFRCGAHGCKFGLLGESVGHDLVVEFIEGAQRELRRTRASGPLTAPYPVGL